MMGSIRVYRGGSWSVPADICLPASRIDDDPGDRNGNLGLRVVVKRRIEP